jgi:hypothetical protein
MMNMKKPIKISKKEPELKSMNYSRLREIGISHIQELSSELWTDYNTHDPGITILEVLCYAITDLGNRANQNIADILEADPAETGQPDRKNFFTAAEILPNKPLTITDLRKLIIDVMAADEPGSGCEFVGVKNAWVNISEESEVPVWANLSESKLSFKEKAEKEQIQFRTLYNILLEFERCESLGDLNEHILRKTMTLDDADQSFPVRVDIHTEIEFARWDDAQIDWSDTGDIRKHIRGIKLRFLNRPPQYSIQYAVDDDNVINLTGTGPGNMDLNLHVLSDELNDFVDGMVETYQKRVEKVHQIVELVTERLHANRNLCEDFYKLNALKIEGIALCADIELETDADVEEVQAQIYHRISEFLAPPVNVCSLKDLMDKGIPTEKIFEGPLLNHGFIDEEELMKSERREFIYVSDLVQIIMNIDGVVAVKEIEIANIPQGNEEGIPSKSMKWCLELAHEHNYVPRLSIADSKITFIKDQLPYQASIRAVEERMKELADEAESQKIQNPKLDIVVPEGRYLNLDQYRSIQNEFPVAYGIGPEGISSAAEPEEVARAKQLKGYLAFFDQLLANYMSQLEHVRELFSMNAEKDEDDQYKIGRTYFTQALTDIIPEGEEIFINGSDYETVLNEIAESPELFIERRNKFLDHLMARFAEQFTDYATLTYRLTNPDQNQNGKERLIRDKLTFLNDYPEISSGRGIAFNYRDRCRLWHINNRSGLERRASLQVGIDGLKPGDLAFTPNFTITEEDDSFGFEIKNSADETLLINPEGTFYNSSDEASEAIEELIISGLFREHYKDFEKDGSYFFTIECDGQVLGVSAGEGYQNQTELEESIDELIAIFKSEFFENPQSNRKNLSAPIQNYFKIEKNVTGSVISVKYTLFDEPFSHDTEHEIFSGELTYEASDDDQAEAEADERAEEFIWDVIINGRDKDRYRFEADESDPEEGDLILTGKFSGKLGSVEASKENVPEMTDKLAGFFRKTFSENEGLHLVEHILLRPKQNGSGEDGIEDRLMPIEIDPECEHCQLYDPYSYVAAIVLPYWQGRFGNMDFRNFLERRIRYEAPAHVFLKICWISNRQMDEFEEKYKRWLIENARETKDDAVLSDALNDLIGVLDDLRNVYPAGRLHDCEDSETLEGSMILNNTILGSA